MSDLCPICGRDNPPGKLRVASFGDTDEKSAIAMFCWIPQDQRCYRIGYEREKARAEGSNEPAYAYHGTDADSGEITRSGLLPSTANGPTPTVYLSRRIEDARAFGGHIWRIDLNQLAGMWPRDDDGSLSWECFYGSPVPPSALELCDTPARWQERALAAEARADKAEDAELRALRKMEQAYIELTALRAQVGEHIEWCSNPGYTYISDGVRAGLGDAAYHLTWVTGIGGE